MSRQWNSVSDRHRKSGKNLQRMDLRNTFTDSVANGQHHGWLADETPAVPNGNGETKLTLVGRHDSRASGLNFSRLSLKSSSWSSTTHQRPPDSEYTLEMEKAMRRWGVVPTRRGVHGHFWHRHMRWIRLVVALDVETLPHLPENDLQVLSADPLRAMEEVFEQEITAMLCNRRGFPVETDNCARANREIVSTHAPYEYNRQTRSWELRSKFAGCDPDPFLRFTFRRIPALAQVQRSFVESEPFSSAMRAIVAHGACHRASCFRCKEPECVRWNRLHPKARSRHFRRLVCVKCHSVYDVFAKETEASIFKCLETRIHTGSKFDAYFAVRQALPAGARQFVSVVSREKARDEPAPECRWNWLVYVAEVESVGPALRPTSFYLEDDNEQCVVNASVKARQGWGIWFKVPVFEFDARAIASSVLRERQRSERRRELLAAKSQVNR